MPTVARLKALAQASMTPTSKPITGPGPGDSLRANHPFSGWRVPARSFFARKSDAVSRFFRINYDFLLHNEEKDTEIFGGYEIITYICSKNNKNQIMPEILRMFGMRFFFYSREHEPIHVHVKSADGKAKFDILPEGIVLVKNEGLKPKDIKAAEMVLEENKELAIEKWNEYFGGSVKNEDF